MAGLTPSDGPPAESRSLCFNRLSSPGQASATLAELTPGVPLDTPECPETEMGLSLPAHWPAEA